MTVDLSNLVEELRETLGGINTLPDEIEDGEVDPPDVRARISDVRENLEDWSTRFDAAIRTWIDG